MGAANIDDENSHVSWMLAADADTRLATFSGYFDCTIVARMSLSSLGNSRSR
jgi:hypothetical protein